MTEHGKRLGMWAKTDQNGYFSLADLPKGEYALKGIRVNFGRGNMVTIVNALLYPSNNYEYNLDNFFIFEGRYFPFKPVGRIVSLQDNIFLLGEQSTISYQVQHFCLFELNDYELVNNEILNDGPIEQYFIQKYPDSIWKGALERSAKVIQFPR